MALLDVSDAFSPDLVSAFNVVRRREDVNQFGEGERSLELIENVLGVVCDAGPDDLERVPDYQVGNRVLSIVTQFRLYGPVRDDSSSGSQDFQPDVIQFGGDYFIVKSLSPYIQFGAGFVQSLAEAYPFIQAPTGG